MSARPFAPRRRGAALTEWTLALILLVFPMILAGVGAYNYMTQSWSLGRVAATVGELYTTSGVISNDDFTAAAARYGVTLTPNVDTLSISITPAKAGCGAQITAAGWGSSPVICQGDLVTIKLGKNLGTGADGAFLPVISLPITASATWSGVSQRDTVGSTTTSSGSSLYGFISNESGTGISGATVYLGSYQTTTGADGSYCMGATGCSPSALEGTGVTQTIKVQAPGYLEAATTILVPVGGRVTQDFTLIAGSQITLTLVANTSDGERIANGAFSTSPFSGNSPVGQDLLVYGQASGGNFSNCSTTSSATTCTWTPPTAVTLVDVVAVGGGGGGGPSSADASSGGGGGGLGYRNDIAVSSAAPYTVVVGAGGAVSVAGGTSYFSSLATVVGYGGNPGANGTTAGGSGGSFVGANGGNGGTGGSSSITDSTNSSSEAGAGGGAGGYAGNGGSGAGTSLFNTGGTGVGGGGGGGGSPDSGAAGGGGGVGLLGQGTSGTGGSGASGGGNGGSSGSAGSSATGGVYGGGGAGSDSSVSGAGGNGGVRIIWGSGRAFPSTLTADQPVVAGSLGTWSSSADSFINTPTSATHDAVAGTLVVQTGTTASAGVRTSSSGISGGSFRAKATYLASIRVKGDVGAKIALLVGAPAAGDYAAASTTGTGAWETLTVLWTPTADRAASSVELAVRGNNDEAVNRRIEIDSVSLLRSSSAISDATISTSCASEGSSTCSFLVGGTAASCSTTESSTCGTGLTATATTTPGRYLITLRPGTYYFAVRTSDGVTTYTSATNTSPALTGGAYVICATSGSGCNAVAGPTGGSLSVTAN